MYNKLVRTNPIAIRSKEIAELLCEKGVLSRWYLDSKKTTVIRECSFANFEQTWGFLTQISMRAHLWGHHPTITTTYNNVKVELTTHDLGDQPTSGLISDIDVKLAKKIEQYIELYNKKQW